MVSWHGSLLLSSSWVSLHNVEINLKNMVTWPLYTDDVKSSQHQAMFIAHIPVSDSTHPIV